MTRNNADFQGGNDQFSHPLFEDGDQPMYRWLHPAQYDEAKSTGFFRPGINAALTPQNVYSDDDHLLVKFAAQPKGIWRKKDLEGRQADFYTTRNAIPFEHAEVVDKGRKP